MSLQVWLPLNGDLHNQGLANINLTNNGATIDNNGKIGKCYSFNGSSSYLYENTYDWSNFNTSEFSLCCWYKEPSPVASGNSQIIHIGTNSGWNNIRIGLLRRLTSGYPMFSVSNGSSAVNYNFTASTFLLDTWNHIAVTYKNGELKMYLNGILDKTSTTTIIPVLNSSQHLGIGAAPNGAEKLTGFLNDVRIYDHALSAKEVEEIAKGLVLHYKLDQPANINYNLYIGSKNFTGTWVNGAAWTTDNNTYNGFTVKRKSSVWGGLSQNITATNGDIFTISFWGKVDSGGNILSIHRSSLGNVTTGLTILDGNFSSSTNWVNTGEDGTQWKRYWATLQITSTDITYLQWRIENSVAGKNLYVAGMTLEKGYGTKNWSLSASEAGTTNIVYDSSGYSNNGYITGTININSGGPKYSSFSQLSAAATISHSRCLDNSNQEWTCVAWVKPTTAGSYQNLNNFNENNRLYHGTYPLLYLNSGANDYYNYGNMALPANEWSHIAFVFKNSIGTKLIYINGENHTNMNGPNKTSTPVGIPDTVIIGSSYEGGLCDYREYATALTPEQIKELYNTSMSIDDKGNIYVRELVEL